MKELHILHPGMAFTPRRFIPTGTQTAAFTRKATAFAETNTINFMKKSLLIQFILLAAVGSLFSGCAAVTRTATDVGLGAGGAALGGELTHNNPYAIVGGAAGGALLGEGLHYANSTLNDKSYQTGYDKGRSDAVKQQYWLYVSIQQAKAGDEGRVRLYEVHLPEQVIDGVIFQPTTQFLRIEE